MFWLAIPLSVPLVSVVTVHFERKFISRKLHTVLNGMTFNSVLNSLHSEFTFCPNSLPFNLLGVVNSAQVLTVTQNNASVGFSKPSSAAVSCCVTSRMKTVGAEILSLFYAFCHVLASFPTLGTRNVGPSIRNWYLFFNCEVFKCFRNLLSISIKHPVSCSCLGAC